MNNYFDGPFDQLPDNFIEGETLRNAILEIDPKLKGKIDRFGGSPDGEIRYMIAPYKLYKKIAGIRSGRTAAPAASTVVAGRLLPLLHPRSRTPQDFGARPPHDAAGERCTKAGA